MEPFLFSALKATQSLDFALLFCEMYCDINLALYMMSVLRSQDINIMILDKLQKLYFSCDGY